MQIFKAALSRVTAVCCCWWASGVWLLPLLLGFLKFFPLTFPPWNGGNIITEFWEYTRSNWAIFLWEQLQVFLRMSMCVICDTRNSTAFCSSQKLWNQSAKWKCFVSILTSSGIYHWCWQYQRVKCVCVTREEPALESSWSSSQLPACHQLGPFVLPTGYCLGAAPQGCMVGAALLWDRPGLRSWTWTPTATLPLASADCHLYVPRPCLL